jgi:hypothetical protein
MLVYTLQEVATNPEFNVCKAEIDFLVSVVQEQVQLHGFRLAVLNTQHGALMPSIVLNVSSMPCCEKSTPGGARSRE